MNANETAPMANGGIGGMKLQAVGLGTGLSGALCQCAGGEVEHRHMIILEGTDDRTCTQEVIEGWDRVALRQRQLQAKLFGRYARVLLHSLQNDLCRCALLTNVDGRGTVIHLQTLPEPGRKFLEYVGGRMACGEAKLLADARRQTDANLADGEVVFPPLA